jgi:GAF domain-containing protein
MALDIQQVADAFVDVADTLVADFDLIEFLHTVAGHAAEITGGAAAGVMLSGHDGRLHHVGASNEDAQMLELFQIQIAEGPCQDSFRTGQPVVAPDLSVADDRWPLFAPRATALGIVAVHAFPLRLRERVIGGLNVFQTDRRELLPDDIRVLQALADMATIALIQERAVTRAEVLTEQLQSALNSRIVVEQAKGAVARVFGVTVDEAFELLRSHARRSRRRLTDVAHEVVTSPDGPKIVRPD